MKVPNPPEIGVHFMAFKTDWLDPVIDDGLNMVHVTVDNGAFNVHHENELLLRVLDRNADLPTLAFGGMLIFSNVNQRALRQAVLVGLDVMLKTNQLSPKDLLDGNEEATA